MVGLGFSANGSRDWVCQNAAGDDRPFDFIRRRSGTFPLTSPDFLFAGAAVCGRRLPAYLFPANRRINSPGTWLEYGIVKEIHCAIFCFVPVRGLFDRI